MPELCTPIGGDMYAICRKHADPMAETLSEAYHRRPELLVSRNVDESRGWNYITDWCKDGR